MTGNQNRPPADHWTMSSTASSTRTRSRGVRSNVARLVVGAGITLTMAVAAAACGDDDSTADIGQDTTTAGDPMSASARSGEELSRSRGCAGCHGGDFDGGAGPGWIGLAGSERLLTDGTTVIADDEYLTTAIVDPSAQLLEGYNLRMPANNLTDAEVADIVAFIETLADG
jgi:mono/diheme cytochrome c family protein